MTPNHIGSVSVTITAAYVKSGSHAGYVAMARPREDIVRDLENMGLTVPDLMRSGLLEVDDWYSATLAGGRIEFSGGRTGSVFEVADAGYLVARSLRVADLSIAWLKQMKGESISDDVARAPPGTLIVADSITPTLRFNEEKPYVEWAEIRVFPAVRKAG